MIGVWKACASSDKRATFDHPHAAARCHGAAGCDPRRGPARRALSRTPQCLDVEWMHVPTPQDGEGVDLASASAAREGETGPTPDRHAATAQSPLGSWEVT